MIDLGFAGDVYVVGLTLEEVELKIAQQLTAAAMQQNQKIDQPYRVSVRLTNVQSKFYYVMGTVTTQGRFPIKGNETVLDAILQAGLKTNSLPEKAYLVRPHPPGEHDQVLKIDWCGIKERGDTLTNYQLFPGDRVVVPGTKPPGLIATLLGDDRSGQPWLASYDRVAPGSAWKSPARSGRSWRRRSRPRSRR